MSISFLNTFLFRHHQGLRKCYSLIALNNSLMAEYSLLVILCHIFPLETTLNLRSSFILWWGLLTAYVLK